MQCNPLIIFPVIPDLSKENISMVFITFSGNSGPQGLHNMSLMANGYFTCYIDAILPAAGVYHLSMFTGQYYSYKYGKNETE